jgi:class 3 adenylate cyclase
LIKTGENLPASVVNQWLLTWGDMHRQAVSGLNGRVRQFIADMALVTFATADDAVQGVLTLHTLAEEHNTRCKDLPPIAFAAAISVGDLILSPTGVVGRLVNQTFRLLNASPRCTVTIDKPVYAQLTTAHERFLPVTRVDDAGITLDLYELINGSG